MNVDYSGGITLENSDNSCNFKCVQLATISKPNDEFILTYSNLKKLFVRTIYYHLPFLIPLFTSVMIFRHRKKTTFSPIQRQKEKSSQNIQAGDIVEVLSEDEIRKTLNKQNKLKGLGFMPEMEQYCGKQFKVFKKAYKIMIESTGELRILKQPIILLEAVYCHGEFHDQCDRSCFLFWREEWLRKLQ